MNNRELEIYNGLKSIGAEIATFFSDAIKISSLDLETKPYLLGHLSREIESGLRDILAPNNEDYVQYCETCKKQLNKNVSHKESILKALGLNAETEFSKKWHDTATQFHKFAHRHGVWKSPREKDEFDKVWSDFVDILEKLVGNYFAISELLDSIVKIKNPSDEIIGSLPNLLKIESRYSYFFQKLESTAWLKSLHENHYFSGDKNPPPKEVEDSPGYFTMPFWSVLDFLDKISQQNFISPNDEISNILLKIIDDIATYRNEKGERTENFRTDYYLLKIIASLPSNKIIDKHFDYIYITFNSKGDSLLTSAEFGKLLLERFIRGNEKELLLKSLKVVFSYKINENNVLDRITSIFSYNFLSEMLNEYRFKIIKICGIDAFNLTLSKVDELIRKDLELFNILSLPTIEEHNQTSSPDKYECQIIYFLRDSILSLSDFSMEIVILLFLRKQHPIYKRLAIFAVNHHFRYFKHFYNWTKNPLEEHSCKHEIYELLKNHAESFSSEELSKIISWIENIKDGVSDDDVYYKEILAYRKKEWLTALVSTRSPLVQELIDKYNTINTANVEHPGFGTWHESFFGNISPIKKDDVTKMTLKELINYFISFSKEPEKFTGPTIEGLCDVLTLSFRHDPQLYLSDYQLFIEAPPQIQYCWIRGLHESWQEEKQTFESIEILKTILKIIDSEYFWESNNNPQGHNYNNWFVSSTLSFIEDGVQKDSHAFEPASLEIIKNILLTIWGKDNSNINDMSELSMTVLNNTKGKIYQAIMQYCLRKGRLNSVLENKWDEDIRKKIEELLRTNFNNPLLYFVLGQFLSNIHYLNEKWLLDKFNNIFSTENDTNWDAAMSGYLYFHPNPNKFYFKLFYDYGHLAKALNHTFCNERHEATSHLIRHICIAYSYEINGFKIEDNLFDILLAQDRKDYFSNIIYHYWSPKSALEPQEIEKIMPLWELLYNHSIELTRPELDKYILSGCTKWLKNLPELNDKVFAWISSSVKYVVELDRYSLMESLVLHVKTNTEKVAKILVEMFSFEVSYDISRGKITSLVEVIYENGFKELANKICLLHGEKGFNFLRETYEKNNPK